MSDQPTRLLSIKLLPLSFIKDINDLCFLCKCIHNFLDIDLDIIFLSITLNYRLGQQVLPLRSVRINYELAGLLFSNRVV